MKELSGKTAVITGASSGIGRATAIRLAEANANLILHYCSNRAGIDKTLDLLPGGGTAELIQADFLRADKRAQFFEGCVAEDRQIDILVNNAGGDVLTTEKKNWSFEDKLDFLWNLDVKSCMDLSRRFGAHMSQNRGSKPCIINIGWDQAPLGQAGENGEIFATTKGAIMSFTRSLAKSLAPVVRVNCVAPGWIQTSWGESTSEYWDQRARSESLLGRWGTADDVANAIVMLSREESEFINGQTVEVNGGLGFGSS